MNTSKDILNYLAELKEECDKQECCMGCPKYLSKVCDNIGYNPQGACEALKYLTECDLTLKK